MKVHCKYRPYLAVMKDDTRPHMCHVQLDVEAKKLYATNGHVAVAVSVEVDPEDKSGLIDAKGYKAIRERYFANGPTNGLISIDCSSPDYVESDGIRWPRPKTERKFPPVESARPKFEGKPTHTFSINANYLRTLALALGNQDDTEVDEDGERWNPPSNVSFTCLAADTMLEAILIRTYDSLSPSNPEAEADAFLMPLRS